MKKRAQQLMANGRVSWVFLVSLIILLLLLPVFITDPYFLHIFTTIFLWVILGQAWNLLAGYVGQISFGPQAFFGVGAYATAMLYTQLGVPPWFAMVIGSAIAALFSVPIGIITLRFRGPYFALGSFAFAEILRLIAVNWRSFTKGAVGILYPVISTSELVPYYIILIAAILTMLFLWKLLRTKVGFYFVTIREDEDVASSLAVNTTAYKLLGLMIMAFLMGVGGGFYSNYMRYIDPEVSFSPLDVGLAAIVVVMVGGLGTLSGPVIGAVIIVAISEFLRDLFPFAHLLIYGILVCFVVLFMPEGLVAGFQILKRRYTSSST